MLLERNPKLMTSVSCSLDKIACDCSVRSGAKIYAHNSTLQLMLSLSQNTLPFQPLAEEILSLEVTELGLEDSESSFDSTFSSYFWGELEKVT